MQKFSKLEYELINETKCGPEELFVLIGGFAKEYSLKALLERIVKLITIGYLEYSYGSRTKLSQITIEELNEYIKKRKNAKEALDTHPEVCEEYSFTATEKGLSILSKKDKPV